MKWREKDVKDVKRKELRWFEEREEGEGTMKEEKKKGGRMNERKVILPFKLPQIRSSPSRKNPFLKSVHVSQLKFILFRQKSKRFSSPSPSIPDL